MLRFLSVLLMLSAVPAHTFADAREDAAFIVEMTETEEVFNSAMRAIAELMADSIQNDMRKNGVTISNDAAEVVADMLGQSMAELMVDEMQEPMIEAYLATLSPQTLHAYRLFLETDEGRELAQKQNILLNEGMKIGESIGEKVAMQAVGVMQGNIAEGVFPEGTLPSTKKELERIFAE